MEAGKNREIAIILKQYKSPQGLVNFPAVFAAPTEERIKEIVKRDFMQATAIVVVALTLAFEKMSFKKKIDGVLVNNIADEIIDTAEQDNISIPDLMLFLQGLVRGEYGNVEELSVSRFMNLFNQYRDKRWEEWFAFKENEHLQYKSLGDSNRNTVSDPLSEHFGNLGQSLHDLKMQMMEQKKEADTIKQANKFYGS
jgi:hypothetical protein